MTLDLFHTIVDTILVRSILAPRVQVGPSVKLEDQQLQSVPFDDGFGDKTDAGNDNVSVDTTCDKAKFGANAVAFEFEEGDDDSDNEDEPNDLLYEKWGIQDDGMFSDGFVSEEEDDGESETNSVGDGDEIDGGETSVE